MTHMRDYKNQQRPSETPFETALACVFIILIFLILVSAPSWAPIIDEVCK